jgi:dimethylglycine catabolism B
MAVEPERIREHQTWIQDGVDISGHWNRMFEPRVIDEYPLGVLDRITALPGGESLGWCYQCGKCTSVCPVDHVGSYSPRKIFRKVQTGVDLFDDPDLWLCTTCMNCLRVCPKGVNMIEIMPAVREQAVLDGNVPAELLDAFENTMRHGNPLGEPQRRRADWVKDAGVPVPVVRGLGRRVDLLWFVECYPAYHPRGRDASRALARVLHALELDFAILGVEERCVADSQRIAGERGIFEAMAEHNIGVMQRYEFDRVLVTDPHAYNAFLREYPKLGGSFDTVHYTQLLAPLMERLPMRRALGMRVTFHDPCYLGRHHGEYDAPRRCLEAIPGVELTEMMRCRANGYCCGGGGGGMWLDGTTSEHMSERLSERRVREAVETGADVLAVCCPFEVSRFEDAVKSTGNAGRLRVLDIAELIDMAMDGAGAGGRGESPRHVGA